jgi:hypothetical protein
MRTFPHHWQRIALGLSALFAFALLACASADQGADDPTSTPWAIPPDADLGLTIQDRNAEEMVIAQDVGEFQEHIPFGIVVPEYLSADVRLANMGGFIGGPGRVRAESVYMSFHSTEAGQHLYLSQSPLPEGMDGMGISGDNVEDVAIGDVIGKLQETEEPDRHSTLIVWTGCGLDFTLIGSGQRGREELMRVAESTLGCRGLG